MSLLQLTKVMSAVDTEKDLRMTIQKNTENMDDGTSMGSTDNSSMCYCSSILFRLCILAFFINFQPSESYLTDYLNKSKGFSDDDINNYVWPFDTYGAVISLLPVGLLTEYIGYKYVIFGGLIFREFTRLILIYGNKLYLMSIMQITYAISMSISWVYKSFIYMVILNNNEFQYYTSCVQSCIHIGILLSSILGQLLVSYTFVGGNDYQNYVYLFYLSWISTSMGLVSFFFLPKIVRDSPESMFKIIKNSGCKGFCNHYVRYLYYPNKYVILWTFWWIPSFACYSIYSNYYQTLFEDICSYSDCYYGVINSLLQFGGIIGSLLPIIYKLRNNNILTHYWFIIISTIIQIGMFILGTLNNLIISYSCTVILFFIYNMQLAYGMTSIAIGITNNIKHRYLSNNYVIIFTFNCFISLILTTIIQIIASILNINTKDYYYICAVIHGLIIIFLLIFYQKLTKHDINVNNLVTNEQERHLY